MANSCFQRCLFSQNISTRWRLPVAATSLFLKRFRGAAWFSNWQQHPNCINLVGEKKKLARTKIKTRVITNQFLNEESKNGAGVDHENGDCGLPIKLASLRGYLTKKKDSSRVDKKVCQIQVPVDSSLRAIKLTLIRSCEAPYLNLMLLFLVHTRTLRTVAALLFKVWHLFDTIKISYACVFSLHNDAHSLARRITNGNHTFTGNRKCCMLNEDHQHQHQSIMKPDSR